MKSFIIATGISNHTKRCQRTVEACVKDAEPEIFDATTPMTLNADCKKLFGKMLKYTWPIYAEQNRLDLNTGLYLRNYSAKDHVKIVACSLSHMRLWKKCVDLNVPIMILEHDAQFTRKFSYDDLGNSPWGAVGLNDPRGATRKAQKFYDMLADKSPGIHNVPSIDQFGVDDPLPMGLAGNSAYVIKPFAAQELLDKTLELGIWPNDALMCKQLFPWVKVVTPFYTNVQGVKSTTTT